MDAKKNERIIVLCIVSNNLPSILFVTIPVDLDIMSKISPSNCGRRICPCASFANFIAAPALPASSTNVHSCHVAVHRSVYLAFISPNLVILFFQVLSEVVDRSVGQHVQRRRQRSLSSPGERASIRTRPVHNSARHRRRFPGYGFHESFLLSDLSPEGLERQHGRGDTGLEGEMTAKHPLNLVLTTMNKCILMFKLKFPLNRSLISSIWVSLYL